MSKNNKKKKKKEKIIYVDDGRTIADMSATSKTGAFLGSNEKSRGKHRASTREVWATYKAAVKMMFFPMLVVIGIICIAFLIMSLIYG